MARSRFFTIKYITNPHRRHPRLAVVISRKTLRTAVARNRLRRRIYETARPFLTATAPAIDAVITVYSSEALVASHQELSLQLLPLLHRAGFRADGSHTLAAGSDKIPGLCDAGTFADKKAFADEAKPPWA